MQHQFRKLTIWNRSMQFVSMTYKITALFPDKEQYGLTSQIRRAATSISLNIAEGSGCHTNIEFIRFLYIAKRSTYEVTAGLEIAKNLKYGNLEDINKTISESEEICSMISGLINKLKPS